MYVHTSETLSTNHIKRNSSVYEKHRIKKQMDF